jgi:hypothetical protein
VRTSARWPGDNAICIGRPQPSTHTVNLVLSPPLVQPLTWFSLASSRVAGVLMHLDIAGIHNTQSAAILPCMFHEENGHQ